MAKAPLSSRRGWRVAALAVSVTGCSASGADEGASPTAPTTADPSSGPTMTTSMAPSGPPPKSITSTLLTLENLAEIGSTMRAPNSTWDLWEQVPIALRPATADAPIAVYTVSLARDQRVVYPSDQAVDVMGVVVEGTVKMHPLDDESGGSALTVWQGFRAPEANVELVNTGKTNARIVIAIAMNPPGAPLLAHLPTTAPERPKPRSMFDKSPAAPPAPPRTKRVDVIDFPTRRLLTWGAGAYHVRIGFEATSYEYKGADGKAAPTTVNDAPPAVIDAMLLSEDAPVAAHVHEKEWECVVALVADGDLMLADSPTGTPAPVPMKDGSVQCVPPNKLHAWKPRGTKPFVALQFYAAPGPEQRFKKLAASEQQ